MKYVFHSFSLFSIFVSWSLLLSHHVVVAFNLSYEGEALLSLFSSGSDDIKLSWNNSSTPCDWSGIGCNTEKTHVVSLNLSHYGNNQLYDTFPFFLEKALDLEILVLRSNKLYGPLTSLAFNNLDVLDISNNYFTGELSLEFISRLESMNHMVDRETFSEDTNYHQISTVVTHKGIEMKLNRTLMTTFRAIDMSNNRFQGVIPESIGELVLLKMLNLSNNNFIGHIPLSLGNLTQLESLDLSVNKLFGEIPWQLTNLNFLAALNLSSNNLKGRVPNGGQFQTFTNASFDGNSGLCGNQLSRRCEDDTDKERHRDPTEEKESHENSKSWNFGWEPVVIGYGCGVLIGLVIQYFIFTKASMYRWFIGKGRR